MSVDVMSAHIEKAEGEPARLRLKPRVRVAQIVMDYLAYGWSVDEMCRQHPNLTPAEAHAAMTYYFDNQEEIDREVAAELKQLESAAANSPLPPFVARMRVKGLM